MQKKVADVDFVSTREEAADVAHRRMAAFTWIYLIGLGSAFVATFAAATQLWDYPLPRGLLLSVAWGSAVASAHAACAYLVFDNTHKHSYPAHPTMSVVWKAAAFLAGFYLIVMSISAFSTTLPPLDEFLHCMGQVAKDDLCNIKTDAVLPENAARMKSLLNR